MGRIFGSYEQRVSGKRSSDQEEGKEIQTHGSRVEISFVELFVLVHLCVAFHRVNCHVLVKCIVVTSHMIKLKHNVAELIPILF